MKNIGVWQPVIYSFVLTPICLILALFSAGAGHGNYFLVKLFFPYTMLSTEAFGSITNPFIILAFAQMPFYGLLLSVASAKNKLASMGVLIVVIHFLAVIACFLFIGANFS